VDTRQNRPGSGEGRPKVWSWKCNECDAVNVAEVPSDVKGGRYTTVICRQCRRSQIQTALPSNLKPDRRREPRKKK